MSDSTLAQYARRWMCGSGWCLEKGGRRSQHAPGATGANSRWAPYPHRSLVSEPVGSCKHVSRESGVCLVKRRQLPFSTPYPEPCPHGQPVLVVYLQFCAVLEHRCNFSLCRALQETSADCREGIFTWYPVTYLPSTSGLCRRALLKQGCCNFHWEVLLLGSFTQLRWEYVSLFMLLRLCTHTWCSLALLSCVVAAENFQRSQWEGDHATETDPFVSTP